MTEQLDLLPTILNVYSVADDLKLFLSEGSCNDLRQLQFVEKGNNPLRGHCYVASEVLAHLLRERGVKITPMQINHEEESHWYLRWQIGNNQGVVDVTKSQFARPPRYTQGRGRGFLTKDLSKRAVEMLHRYSAWKRLGETAHVGVSESKSSPLQEEPTNIGLIYAKVDSKHVKLVFDLKNSDHPERMAATDWEDVTDLMDALTDHFKPDLKCELAVNPRSVVINILGHWNIFNMPPHPDERFLSWAAGFLYARQLNRRNQ
tara:strand:+ start:24099 stop:24881 length:783 start_codon:yes stop_codon:yes gene_type:complete